MNREIYDQFKQAIADKRRQGMARVEAEFEKDMADLDRLWGRVNDGKTRMTAEWKKHVEPIVASLTGVISQPIVTQTLKDNYPDLMEGVTSTEVSRELRKLEQKKVIKLDEPADKTKGTPNTYKKVVAPASEDS